MTTTTATPRRINADVFRRARQSGANLALAAYVARPPVLDLDFHSGTLDTNWDDFADFAVDGRDFRVVVTTESDCESCTELVEAWREQDDNIAWMTDDEYAAADHRYIVVHALDANRDEIADAALYGVCSVRSTEVDRLADDRYVAETILDLASEAAHIAEQREAAHAAHLAAQAAARAAGTAPVTITPEQNQNLRRYVLAAERAMTGDSNDDEHDALGDLADEVRHALGWMTPDA